jgi:GNAT superfamily N-acetyltransferase
MMAICSVGPADHAEFVAFLDAGMRPAAAPTRTADDFPVVLGAANLSGLSGLRDASGWTAGLAYLVRPFTTTAGTVIVAGIGSVVTREDVRGRGLSRELQNAVLDRLAGEGVHLAVLWTDRPELYAGRGFLPAGWEYHADLADCELGTVASGGLELRDFRASDTQAVAALYDRHPLRTLRQPGDAALLYGMAGTRGRVALRDGVVAAYAFCGKGQDFPGYVAEWGGEVPALLAVLRSVRDAGLAGRVLIPAGGEELLAALMDRGGGAAVVPSGLWAVIDAEALAAVAGSVPAGVPHDARAWLGAPGEDGLPRPGRLQIAVWGFDSV